MIIIFLYLLFINWPFSTLLLHINIVLYDTLLFIFWVHTQGMCLLNVINCSLSSTDKILCTSSLVWPPVLIRNTSKIKSKMGCARKVCFGVVTGAGVVAIIMGVVIGKVLFVCLKMRGKTFCFRVCHWSLCSGDHGSSSVGFDRWRIRGLQELCKMSASYSDFTFWVHRLSHQ